MSADDLEAEIVDDNGTQQAPRTEPLTDPPPRHDPFAHGIGGPGPRAFRPPPEPGYAGNGAGMFTPPPDRHSNPRQLRGDEKRLYEKLTGTYAMVGVVVCAAAET